MIQKKRHPPDRKREFFFEDDDTPIEIFLLISVVHQVTMANNYFRFRQFIIHQEGAAFKVTTDSVLLGSWADIGTAGTILDIGTGTGLLALMTAQRSGAVITAIEPDEKSFRQAGENISLSEWKERITLINTRLQEFTSSCNGRFDAIISNPPYFTASLLNPDRRKALARHNMALPMEDLVKCSEKLLAENGMLHVVIPASDSEGFTGTASDNGLYCCKMLRILPLPDREPKRVLLSLGREKLTTVVSSLVIETGARHRYSDEYLALTGDFYLER